MPHPGYAVKNDRRDFRSHPSGRRQHVSQYTRQYASGLMPRGRSPAGLSLCLKIPPHALHWITRSPKDTYVILRGKFINTHRCVRMGLFMRLATGNKSSRVPWQQSPVLLIIIITKAWPSARRMWVISRYFLKGDPEQSDKDGEGSGNHVMSGTTERPDATCSAQYLRIWHKDVHNKYLSSKECWGWRWKKLQAYVGPWEVLPGTKGTWLA